ncbi:MAG: hypothetical protein ACQEQI_04760 [Bacillota bacterium]
MKIIIDSELKEYAADKELNLIVRRQKINSCCGGKLASRSTSKAKTPPQVIQTKPSEEDIKDYQQFNRAQITIYLHQHILEGYNGLKLGVKRFLGFTRFTVEAIN